MSVAIIVTPDDALRARGLSGKLTDMTMEVSPHGGHLVCIAQYDGGYGLVNVCWGCCEPFELEGPCRMVEVRPGGGPVPVGLHKKCVDPKNRKPFSDMGGSRALQSIEEVSTGLRARKLVSRAMKPFARLGAATKRIISG